MSLLMSAPDLLPARVSSQLFSGLTLHRRFFSGRLLRGLLFHRLLDLEFLVFIKSLLEPEDSSDSLSGDSLHDILALGLPFNGHLDQSTERLANASVPGPEGLRPALQLGRVLVVLLVVQGDAGGLLVRLAVVVLQAVLQLGVAFGRRVVLQVVYRVGRRVDLTVRDPTQAFSLGDFQEQVCVRR